MYDNQKIAERIKAQAKAKKVTLKVMLGDLDMGINLVSQLGKGHNIAATALARIADYLDCSVDYLLGRSNDPESHRRSGA